MIHDVRFGLRQLLRQRGSSAVAVLTLALGIGVSSALFSVVDATLLRPLPYPDPERLIELRVDERQRDGQFQRMTASMEDLRSWQAADHVVSVVAGHGHGFHGRILAGAQPERIEVQYLTEGYLPMLGVAPVIGRNFAQQDCEAGAPLVALLGYGHWQSHYGGRQDVLGETIRFDTETGTIVGVLPAWFDSRIAVSLPLQVAPDRFAARGRGGALTVYARLRPDVTAIQARERLTAHLSGRREARAVVVSRLEEETSQYQTTLSLFAAAVGLILLLACVNVASVLLARGAARDAEFAVRASLGASRGRLIRQVLVESVLLAVPGAILGVALAWLSLNAIVANLPFSLPPNSPVTINLWVLAATLTLLVPTTILFGLTPAVRLSRARADIALSSGRRHVGSSLSRRGGQALIAGEMALAMLLVAGAGLMIRSFVRLSTTDLGFDPDGLVTMHVRPLDRSPAAQTEYYRALLDRIQSSGLSPAGLVDNPPLGGNLTITTVSAKGGRSGAYVFRATPGYLETIGASLRAGRMMTRADEAAGVRGAVISEAAARILFPDGSAVGREFTRAADARPWTVVGVIANFQNSGPLESRARVQIVFPFETTEHDLDSGMAIVMRPGRGVPELADQLRRLALSIGAPALVERISTAPELFGERVVTPRRRTVLLGLLGGLGLALALVGVFGITGYAVTRRTAEIGVRLAFGARPGQVVRTMLHDAAVPIAAGILLGIAGVVAAGRVVQSFLFETTPTDPLTLAAVCTLLAAAGHLAALAPSLRAAKVDPATTLRAE